MDLMDYMKWITNKDINQFGSIKASHHVKA
jgi:hypothetical protein